MSLLPLGYAVRNLARRRLRSILTFAGLGLVAFLVILTGGFARGLDASVASSARDDVAMVVAASGETDLVRSFVALGNAQQVAQGAPGVLVVDDRRAASIEVHTMTRIGDRVGLLRGVTEGAYLVHPAVVVVEGVEPRGPYELMVGRLAGARLGVEDEALAVGKTISLEHRDWTIVGRFAAPGTVLEAEVWGRLEDVMTATRRVDVSAVALRLSDPTTFPYLKLFALRNPGLEVTALPETDLFGELRSRLAPLAILAQAMAVLVLVGGVFACANTMFAAVLGRTRELGALRAIGYGPFALGLSLLQESLALGAAGGLLAFGVASAIGEVTLRFPAGAFSLDVGSGVRGLGLLAAVTAGFVGGIVPAVRAASQPLTDALAGKT